MTSSEARFDVVWSRHLLAANQANDRHVVVRITAPKGSAAADRPPVVISFALDRSGSMAGEKIRLAREAVEQAVGLLCARDRFSIVAYDDRVEVIVENSPADREIRDDVGRQLRHIKARSTTNLGEGWLTSCGQIAAALEAEPGVERLGRCLLLTDGLANQGITDPAALCTHATALRQRGVSTSTFGVGADFDEVLLGQLADAGGGSFYFIESTAHIAALMREELSDALEVVARDVHLAIRLPPGVEVEPVGPFRATGDEGWICFHLPDLVSRQGFDLPIRLRFPPAALGTVVKLELELRDRQGVFGGATHRLQARCVEPGESEAQPRDASVDRLVARRYTAQARERGAQLNRDRRYDEAKALLRCVARRIRAYEGDDTVLRALVDELERDARRYGAPLDDLSRKSLHYTSSLVLRSREVTGSKPRR